MKLQGDWLPGAMVRFRKIEEIFRTICIRHGYGEVRTPVVEKLHWFTGAGILSPDLMHKIYTFIDWDGWSGERVVLRPDNTVPVCRLFSQKMKKQNKARLFYVSDIFRYEEEENAGGEECQLGVELLGNFKNHCIRDVELLILLMEFLKELKLGKPKVVISHAGILHSYLAALDLPEEDEIRAFDLLMEGRFNELQRICSDLGNLEGLKNLLELRGSSASFLTNLKSLGKSSAEFARAVEELETVCAQLESLGFAFEIFPGIHRDLSYYTGIIYDVYVDDVLVGGGGRYDNLLKKFMDKSVGGSGFSVYMDPLADLMKTTKKQPCEAPKVSLLTDFKKPEYVTQAFKAASRLRKKNIVVEVFDKKQKSGAGKIRGEVKNTKIGWALEARSGGKKEIFPLPLKATKKIQNFWEI